DRRGSRRRHAELRRLHAVVHRHPDTNVHTGDVAVPVARSRTTDAAGSLARPAQPGSPPRCIAVSPSQPANETAIAPARSPAPTDADTAKPAKLQFDAAADSRPRAVACMPRPGVCWGTVKNRNTGVDYALAGFHS